MELQIRLFASLRERAGTDELTLADVPDGSDVAAAKRLLVARHPELGSLDHVRGVLGTAYVEDDTPLEPGQVLHLLPPVSGGSEGSFERGVFELARAPLDPGAAHGRVLADHCGAAVVFTGATRNRNRGREVVRLEYEAFDAMTGPEMERIFEDCLAQFGPGSEGPEGDEQAPTGRDLRLLVQHRIGVVEIGQPSVVVAAASPHRDTAFRAARFLIDDLKRRLPVWKKEIYADGAHWIGDRS
jgi:molybdopterin synthase catalytic subunit/molybdopterin converting factor small subunit